MLNTITSAVTILRIDMHAAIHQVPLCQIFALNACHSWGQGLDLACPSYEDLDMHRALAGLVAARTASSLDKPT